MSWKLWIPLFFGLLAGIAVAVESTAMRLVTGEQYQMRSPEAIVRTAVGNPDIVSVKVINSREILLTAKADGATSLMVWKKGYKNPLRYQVNTAPSVSGLAANAEIQAVQGGVVVSGYVNSLNEHQSALAGAGKAAVDTTLSTGAIQVQTDIRIVEISRSELKSAGALLGKNTLNTTAAVGPPGSLGGVEGVGGAFNLLTSSGFLPNAEGYSLILGKAQRSLLGVISALQNNGYAYTLAEPSLVAMSGQSASFLAGGEFPYPASNDNGDIDIQYREFGVRLRLTPTVLDNQSIMLKVAPEVSELDFVNGIQTGGVAVPSLRVRRTDTSVQLASGESFIISGLISSRTTSNADKFPGLGDIPVLGAFFRSTRFEQEDKELIMIVTPHLVRPIAANVQLPELPGEIYRRHSPSFGDMLFGDTQPKHSGKTWSSPGVGFSD
ncbi:type II and III secretion system protein family protein [Litorivivens sp.]|uniref:type II and III secretion system protein family protein n=2 Tax=Litorivivens sp. TaxID=2020868 RepID=UPI003563AF0F